MLEEAGLFRESHVILGLVSRRTDLDRVTMQSPDSSTSRNVAPSPASAHGMEELFLGSLLLSTTVLTGRLETSPALS